MEMHRTKVHLFLLLIILLTVVVVLLQYPIISDLTSYPLVQRTFSLNYDTNNNNNGGVHIQELQENAEHKKVGRINEEQNDWRQETYKNELGGGSTQSLNGHLNNSSSKYTPVKEPRYTTSYRRVTEPVYPNIFQYDKDGNRYLKDGELTTMRPGATKELILSAPELFEKIPTRFLNNFKNPCWLRDKTELNCLPYFYMIGMYKCATTDVHDKIVAHPDVITAPKEPHWWGPRRHGWMKSYASTKGSVLRTRNVTGGADDSSLEWYLNLYKYEVVPQLIEERIQRGGRPYHPSVFGDGSISTAFAMGMEWLEQYPNAKEPPYTNADLIRALQPNAKIVLMVRNPTKRAISWWWYNHMSFDPELHSAKDLHEEMVKFIDCFEKCLESHNLRYCAYVSGCPYELIPNIQAGIYHVYLQGWIRAFSRDSVLVIRLEDWQANQVEVYRKVLEFLDLRRLTITQVKGILNRETKNINKKEHEEAWPETVRLLDDFFRPYNKELAKLMGDDKFLYL